MLMTRLVCLRVATSCMLQQFEYKISLYSLSFSSLSLEGGRCGYVMLLFLLASNKLPLSLTLSTPTLCLSNSPRVSPCTVTSLQLFCSMRKSQTFGFAHGSARFSAVKGQYVQRSSTFLFESCFSHTCVCSLELAGTSWCQVRPPTASVSVIGRRRAILALACVPSMRQENLREHVCNTNL